MIVMFNKLTEKIKWLDEKIGPNSQKYDRACQDDREMVMDCVLNSDCFKVISKEK